MPMVSKPGAERVLPEHERGAASGAGLLRVVVGEEDPLVRDAIDVRGAAAHHAAVIRADVADADVVAPDDEDVRLRCSVLGCRAGAERAERQRRERGQAEESSESQAHS